MNLGFCLGNADNGELFVLAGKFGGFLWKQFVYSLLEVLRGDIIVCRGFERLHG